MEKAKLQNENLKSLESMTDQDKIDAFNFLTNFKTNAPQGNGKIILSSGMRINITAMNYCEHGELFHKFKSRKNSPYRRELLEDGTEVCHTCQLPF
jgi:hypothetical protein